MTRIRFSPRKARNRSTRFLQTHNNDLILNCDETPRKLYPNNIWALREATYVEGDDKDYVAVLLKGKTPGVEESQLGDVESHWRGHSGSADRPASVKQFAVSLGIDQL
jgi:hypothetical protein